ncbi:MAG: tyrosine-type recombinase/integrase [Bryobacterales bacterium]|nr:tyrosine-type recombinase/integrase [Bryobacterales bacterium]
MTLPVPVLAALRGIVRPGRSHFFWTGTLRPESAAKYRRRRLQRVACEAGVKAFHPNQLRHPFAVELRLADTMIQDVWTMLGHTSVTVTERYYPAVLPRL